MTDTCGDTHPNAMSAVDILLCQIQGENRRLQAQLEDLEADKRRLEAQVRDTMRLANEAWETKHIFGFALSEPVHVAHASTHMREQLLG